MHGKKGCVSLEPTTIYLHRAARTRGQTEICHGCEGSVPGWKPGLAGVAFLFGWFMPCFTEEFQGYQRVVHREWFNFPMSFPSCPLCSNTFGNLDSARDDTVLWEYIWLSLTIILNCFFFFLVGSGSRGVGRFFKFLAHCASGLFSCYKCTQNTLLVVKQAMKFSWNTRIGTCFAFWWKGTTLYPRGISQ